MLAHGSIHSHKVQVLSREPRIQLFREFANPDIVRTALLDLDGASAGGPTLDAGGYDPTNRFGLRALKTLVVNATYYPSVISSPFLVPDGHRAQKCDLVASRSAAASGSV